MDLEASDDGWTSFSCRAAAQNEPFLDDAYDEMLTILMSYIVYSQKYYCQIYNLCIYHLYLFNSCLSC